MMFQRRHYEALAAWLKELHQNDATLAESLANMLAKDNGRFDRERFLKAAGAKG